MVQLHDPSRGRGRCRGRIWVKLLPLDELRLADAVVLAVAHNEYAAGGWPLIQRLLTGGNGLVYDVKSTLDRGSKPAGIDLLRL